MDFLDPHAAPAATPTDDGDAFAKLALYHLIPQVKPELGITPSNTLCIGMELSLCYLGSEAFDLIADEVTNGYASDCLEHILLPEGGLEVGKAYCARVINVARDWETGAAEDWDIQLLLYTGPMPEGRGRADEVGEVVDEEDV